jgi:hypothetical protein
MADTVATASVKLVTIMAPVTLGDRIVAELRDIGVTGYTTARANGWGGHGARQFGLSEEPNIRIDTLVSVEMACAILARIDARAAEDGLIAYVLDAEAVPRRHFP